MASLDYNRGRASRWETWKAVALLLFLLAAYVLACSIDANSLDPRTDCRWDEVRMATGECR